MSYWHAFPQADRLRDRHRLHVSLMMRKIFFYFIAEKVAQFKYFTYLCIKLNKQKRYRYGLHTLLGIQRKYRSERL